MRALSTSLSIAMIVAVSLGTNTRGQRETVPFVGCPGNVQGETTEVPHGKPQVVIVDAATAGQIAFYESGATPSGVFAPRGWQCRGWAGSAGGSLLITPGPIDSTGPAATTGPAVEIEFMDGGTSGRFGVAMYASRLFPKVAAEYIQAVKSESILADSEWHRPRASDSVRYADSVTVEFTTPASKTGIGTESGLSPSRDAIRGIAVLENYGDWGMQILWVRLGANRTHLEAAILRLNEQCMHGTRGC